MQGTTNPSNEAAYLDLANPSFSMTSDAVHQARDQSWYAVTDYGLAILRYDEVSKLLKHPKLRQGSGNWPERNGITSGRFHDWWHRGLLALEGADHNRIRRLANPAFSAPVARSLGPKFEQLADEVINSFIDAGRCEFIADFAEPYVTRILCAVLGIPESEWRRIAELNASLGCALRVTIKEDIDEIEAALQGLEELADELIEQEKKGQGTSDFVAKLVQASSDGDSLSDAELRNLLVLLIFGGTDTTRNQLGLAIQTFMEHPDQWEYLAAHPEIAANAVNEVMRINATTTWVTREAITDFTYQDLDIKQGTTIHLLTRVAATDPAVGGDAPFDIHAKHKPHFAFGGGIHYCLGHFVARADMAVALPKLAARMTNIRPDGKSEWMPDSGNAGPISQPIKFDLRQ